MAKDLSGTNVLAQKEALDYTVVFLVEIVRDHPETGESIVYICSWTKQYVIDSKTHLDLLMPQGLGDLRMSIPAGGGIATVSVWNVDILNPTDAGGRQSDMLDDYFLENDEIRWKMVFKTGSETAADILTLFAGDLQDPEISTLTFSLSAKDGTRKTLKEVPQEIADPIEFPNIPIDNTRFPIPVAIGDLNVEPFNTAGSRPRLAHCIAVDKLLHKYTSSRFNKTGGQPYVFYRSARMYSRIEDYTVSGIFFTIDSSLRFSKIKPIRPLATNDVATWQNVVDGSTATGAAIVASDNLDVQFRGVPKLGTISAIEVRIEASGSFNYTVQKQGETDITGGGTGGTSVSLSSWNFSSNWDFEQIKVLIDGTGAATINLITLDITFLEQETGDQLAYPVFQSVQGYEDQAARYQDGGAIVGAGTLIENPIDVLLALMRDKRMGMRMETAQIETSNLAAERTKLTGWKFAFSLDLAMDINALSDLAVQGKIRMFRTFDGKWKLSVFDKTNVPVAAFFHESNIAITNPEEEDASKHETSLTVGRSPMAEIFNEFLVRYGWDPALGTYTEQEIASPHYLVIGTGTLNLSAGTLTDTATPATFVTDGVQVGYKCFMDRDQLYKVDAVVSETVLQVSTVDPGGEVSDGHVDTYYIGPNFNFDCHRSSLKYKLVNRMTIESRFIQDKTTAQNLIAHVVEYYGERRMIAPFRTWLNGVNLELGDFMVIDHPDIPPKKRPTLLGTLSAGINDSVVALPMTTNQELLAQEDDILFLKPADGAHYRECVIVTGIDDVNGEIDVTRAEVGTIARAWSAGDEVWRFITKFEAVDLNYQPNGNGGHPEIEITPRETPRFYVPVGHVAPDGTPDYADASAEERIQYGWVTYPNGEVVWLDPDSAQSFVGA